MVQSKSLTQYLRFCIPVLGIGALIALFLILPEISNFFTGLPCKTCILYDPYLALIGCGYFGILIAVSLLFPTFPSRHFALGGWIWALVLACILTYIKLPDLCLACLVAHACNILIWSIWFFVPSAEHRSNAAGLGMRLCLLLFAPVSIIALFSSLNLTFMAYNVKNQPIGLHVGDATPTFTAQTMEGRGIAKGESIVLNFITPECPYCEEQFRILHTIKSQLADSSYRIINISPVVLPGLVKNSPISEWIEDREGKLRKLFKVQGFPTMYVLGSDEKIIRIIQGVPAGLKEDLQKSLIQRRIIPIDS